MSIMHQLFGIKSADQGQQINNNQQGNQNNGNQGSQNNPANVIPNQNTQQTTNTDANGIVPKQEEAPLDKYKELWDPVKQVENKEDEQRLTPQQILEASGRVDFSKVLNPDDVKKVAAGGEEGVAAMVSLMNQVAKAAYGQSAVAAHKMVEAAVENATNKFAERVPDLLRRQNANAGLMDSNPGFKNPAVSPIVTIISEQLASKYPNATAKELNEHAMTILQGAANVINPDAKNSKITKDGKDAQNGKKKEEEEDWLAWVEQDKF